MAIYRNGHEVEVTVFDSEIKAEDYREKFAKEIWEDYEDGEFPGADEVFESDKFIGNGEGFFVEECDVQ